MITLKQLENKYYFLENIELKDNGWAKILDNMSSALLFLFNTYGKCDFRILRIKEKYGTLRIYYVVSDDLKDELKYIIHSIISLAEDQSKYICMKCGDYGTLKDDDWLHVYCDKCEQQYRKK